MRNATSEKRMGSPAAAQTNQTKHDYTRILRDFIRTTKHCRALSSALLGAGGGALVHNFIVVTAFLIGRFA